jgi:ADP-heptose:LPS heptosyltransferase
MDKIVFFHMNQLGDTLFSAPILKAAKEESGAKIYSVIKSGLAPLLISSGLIDGFIPKELSFFQLIKALKKESFNKAVLFSESSFSLMSAFAAGIKDRTGFKTASLNFLLTKKAERNGVPSIYNNFNLGHAFGLKNIQKDYTGILKIPEANSSNIDKWLKEKGLDDFDFIAIAPCSSAKRQSKRLPMQKWAQIIDGINNKGANCDAKCDAKCILSGAKWEKEELSKIANLCKSKPEIFTAENGILDSAAFYKRAKLFIGIDSGAMHLAAAAGTKCAAIFISTDPAQTGPLPKEKHIIISDLINPQDFFKLLNGG